ncbi:ATP-dependent helicase [Massilia antarctica]|uniref:ATP-dependent helicase n=1 Tax=Massilia antarctica TaxID=2765360 RepID=A0AA49A9K5_9BURK|nr:UvrD-helicase domain-containing protein [Massilia antarctica]QPI50882.1 ATP-dependent helicase [Massilia antarctica]
MKTLKATKADHQIQACINEQQSFYVIAGAGSGKTTSLISALDNIRNQHGKHLRREAQRIVCVTYTKRAVAVISSRLGWDDLYIISTLHGFLWSEIKRFTPSIRKALQEKIIPGRIAKQRADDDGGKSKKALTARTKAEQLAQDLLGLASVPSFTYNDSNFSNYLQGEIGHEDVIDVAAYMIAASPQLRKIMGQKYPYIFVDEAQDTQENVVEALNMLCQNPGLPIIGYFGDPMQQIYDKRAGDFKGPADSMRIPKEENFRCSVNVINLLNAFRKDIQQFPAGKNADIEGSVILRLIQTDKPGAPRGRYTPEQIESASYKLDDAMAQWGWKGKEKIKHLYLVRQMIARRLGFSDLHNLFTGDYASTRAQDDYENGEHYLLKPFIVCLYPLVKASRAKDGRGMIDILRQNSPAFDPKGKNASRPLIEMRKRVDTIISDLNEMWDAKTVEDILRYFRKNDLYPASKRLVESLDRNRREEPFDVEKHALEKGDWLADALFDMGLEEIATYCEFIDDNTEFSTQHGVKGEEYESVLVVIDDVGSAWNNYSFAKTLTPKSAGGEPTDRQRRLSNNLAYVCFSRAEKDLRIVMYSQNAAAAKLELLEKKLFTAAQIEVA